MLQARLAVSETQKHVEGKKQEIAAAVAKEAEESARRHEEEAADLRDLSGFQDQIPQEVVALQQSAEAEFKTQEQGIHVEEDQRMQRVGC